MTSSLLRSTPRALRPISALAVLCGAILTAACGAEEGEAGPGSAATLVDAARAERETLSADIRAVGSLEANARTEIRPEMDGHVTEILYREGAEVSAGEVLLRLDQNKLRAELEAARATAARTRAEARNLERQVERNDSLRAQGAISEQAFDDLQTRYEAAAARLQEAEANVALARERLEDATIRAPFEGRAGARAFDLGDYVQAGDRLFTLIDDDPMEVRFSVPERYLGQLEEGSPVTLRVQNLPERRFRGKVDYVSPYVDPTNRTVELKARVPNPASELRDGQFANVKLELEARESLLVPEAAVIPTQSGSRVYVIRDETAHTTAVRTGLRREGRVEILSGVSAGDTVVVAGYQRLSDGAPVEVRLAGRESPPGGPAAGSASAATSRGEDPASGPGDEGTTSDPPRN